MTDAERTTILQQRLELVRERVAAACQRAGRRPEEVTVVAVTKTVSSDIARLLPALGVVHLGENRPQELWKKAAAVPGVRWHLIGHLQRNKIERTLPLTHFIHSVDSVRLLEALDAAATQQGRASDVLLEVNTSGEASKQGFAAEDVDRIVTAVQPLQQVRLRGLMTMAALQDPEACRPSFARLRCLRERLAARLGRELDHLSMGMSNDFDIAIEEGATIIRLGTLLFQGLET